MTSRIRCLMRCPYFADDLLILFGVLLIGVICVIALRSVGITSVGQESWKVNSELYAGAAIAIVVVEIFWLLIVRRPARPIRPCLFYIKQRPITRSALRSSPMLAGVIVFTCLFSVMKSSIPLFHLYQWDRTFIVLDRTIHGNDPWRLLQPILGYPIITAGLAAMYHLWLLLIYVGSIYMALYVANLELRRRFFVTFFGIWIVCGTILATCLASVGPCFVGRMLSNPYYDEQLMYLRMANTHFPIMVLKVQDQLMAWNATSGHELGAGISAMPSMHVALAFLFFLAMRKVSRKAGWFFGAFFVVILIGSVHLGYHYAVDGYVSILVTLLIWKIAGLWPTHKGMGAQERDAIQTSPVPALLN